MPTQSLFEGSISALQKSLNMGSLRHKVLTANIANIDTPNYKAFEVVMEDERKKNDRPAHPIELVAHPARSPEWTQSVRNECED